MPRAIAKKSSSPAWLMPSVESLVNLKGEMKSVGEVTQQASLERKRLRERVWRAKNRDRVLAKQRARREEKADEIRAYERRWYADNKDHRLAQLRERYHLNHDHRRAQLNELQREARARKQ